VCLKKYYVRLKKYDYSQLVYSASAAGVPLNGKTNDPDCARAGDSSISPDASGDPVGGLASSFGHT
jgi:hypothetical protein